MKPNLIPPRGLIAPTVAALLTTAGIATASTVNLLEDYEALATPQTGVPFAGDGDIFYGLFESPATNDGLRVTWGEAYASGVDALTESGNTFVRASVDHLLPSGGTFLGILDHPSPEANFGNSLAGDYASLFDTPVIVAGSDFSVDVRVPVPGDLPANYSLSLRWLFTDPVDDEELVTSLQPIVADGTFHSVSFLDLDPSGLISLGGDNGGPVDGVLTSGVTTFPVAVEVFGNGVPTSSFHIDFDNFAMNEVNPIPEPASAILAVLGIGICLRRRR